MLDQFIVSVGLGGIFDNRSPIRTHFMKSLIDLVQ